jgi:hypothetical protein
VLELDLQAGSELLERESRTGPIDADPLTDCLGLLS